MDISAIQTFLSFILRHREALYLIIIAALSVVVVHVFKLYTKAIEEKEQILRESILYEREKGKSYEELIKSLSKPHTDE